MHDITPTALDNPDVWVPYRYHPSKVAAAIFVALFSVTTFLHIFQIFKKRTWYFIPLVVGGTFEIVGMIARIISSNNQWKLTPFIIQSILLLVAPALFAASIYIILGRIILLVDGEKYSLIPQKWLTMTFVIGDVFSFLVQSGGAGMQAGATASSVKTGNNIIIVGLFLQVAFFGIFILVAGIFHRRFVAAHPPKGSATGTHQRVSSDSSVEVDALPWKKHLYVLYFASALILIRSIFRVIEYLMGNDGYLLRHEVFLYIFDALLMLGVMCIFNWAHPSQVTEAYQKRQNGGYPMQDTRQAYLAGDEEQGKVPGRQTTWT